MGHPGQGSRSPKTALEMQNKDMKAFMYEFSAVDMEGVVNIV
jgi:hypothetical protein